MLSDAQLKALDAREPDVFLCAHVAEITMIHGGQFVMLKLAGHMQTDGDDESTPVEDHRLLSVLVGMSPESWTQFAKMVRMAPGAPPDLVPPDNIARFLGSIPDMFLPKKEDDS